MKKVSVMFALLALAALVAFGADVTGKWTSEGGGKGGPQTFNLKADGSKLTGTVEGRGGPTEIANGKVDGDTVSFSVTRDMGDKGKMTINYKGKVEGDTLKLMQTREGSDQGREVVLKKSGT